MIGLAVELLAGAVDHHRRATRERLAAAADTFNERSPICIHTVSGGWLVQRGCWASVGAVFDEGRAVGVVVTLGRLALAAIVNPSLDERRRRRELEREWEKS